MNENENELAFSFRVAGSAFPVRYLVDVSIMPGVYLVGQSFTGLPAFKDKAMIKGTGY